MSLTKLLLLLVMGVNSMIVVGQDKYHEARQQMVVEIKQMVAETSAYIGKSSLSEDVMTVMGKVPRHEFVPQSLHSAAYINRPLPIGNDQTISQPYIVALMTDLAGVNRGSIVLEVGTGSGYQAAILAELAKHIYTIEIIEPLGKQADEVLTKLGYKNITVRVGDGYHGWPEHAPFDAILVTAAPEQIPQPLLDQLAPGGRMVIPVGNQYSVQSLKVIHKDEAGRTRIHDVLPVGFVPLTREQ